MKKGDLVHELEQRFILHDNQLYLKTKEKTVSTQPKTVTGTKKRITPQFVGELDKSPKAVFGQSYPTTTSTAVKRVLKKADEMNEYYKNRGDIDEYPHLAF